MFTKYSVSVENYAQKHFIKSFEKKYHRAWDITMDALIRELQSFEVLLDRGIAEKIVNIQKVNICKIEFKVAGTNQSRHGSGNRGIVAVHKDSCIIRILLIYHKNDLRDGNETAQWKQLIKDNYPEYRGLL